ncbi:MAG TPA: hypothetical protein PLY73_13535, partial [Candidatus Ozemobacteraceae bacterium]|nr:hypothetical protein [Candidatus Ozemobacteraceae bacterium]
QPDETDGDRAAGGEDHDSTPAPRQPAAQPLDPQPGERARRADRREQQPPLGLPVGRRHVEEQRGEGPADRGNRYAFFTVIPASATFNTPMLCSSLNRLFRVTSSGLPPL